MMRGILADRNNEGHVALLVTRLMQEPWREFWLGLNLSVFTFTDLGLAPNTPDTLIWEACQQHQVALVTINRNALGPDSLEMAIRTRNTAVSLPVFTLANADRIRTDMAHAQRAAERPLEYLLEIDKVRGTGRLYLP